jgi:hypothetical protein
METKGIEVSLTTRNLNATRLKWTTSLIFSVYDQKKSLDYKTILTY